MKLSLDWLVWWQCWEVFIIWKNGRSCGDLRLCKRMHMLVWVLLVALPCLLVDVWWFWYGQNGVLPLSKKLSSILPHFSNYLGKCPWCETWFLDNRVIAELDLKKKKNWNSSSIWIFSRNSSSTIFFFSVHYNSIVQKLSFKLELDF